MPARIAELSRRPSEPAIFAPVGRIGVKGPDRGGALAVTSRRERSAKNNLAGPPGKGRVKTLSREERGEMDESTSPVRLPGAAARRFGHVCAFFHNRDEEYHVLLPLAKEGFDRGEKVFHIVDPEHRPERMRRPEEVGISPAAARRPGQVEVRAW